MQRLLEGTRKVGPDISTAPRSRLRQGRRSRSREVAIETPPDGIGILEGIFPGEADEGVLILTERGEVLGSNAAARRLLGMNEAELSARGRDGIIRDGRLAAAISRRREKGIFRGELFFHRADGSVFAAEVGAVSLQEGRVGIVFRRKSGDQRGPGGTSQTRREEPSERAPERLFEGFFRALVEKRPGIVVFCSREGRIRYASPSVGRVLGRDPGDLVGADLSEHLHPEDRERVMTVFSEVDASLGGTFRLRHSSGRWVRVSGSVSNLTRDPEVGGVALVGKEPDAPKEACEGRSRYASGGDPETEKIFRTTFDEVPVGIAHVGLDGRWLRVNNRLCELLDFDRRELLGRTFQEMTHSDDVTRDLEAMREMLGGGRDSFSIEKRYIKKDFSSVWVDLSASLMRDRHGAPAYFACVIEDITEPKRAQRVLDSLSEREVEVLKLLAHGLTNRQIAASMNFSLSSAKVYVGRVIHKLGASDRTHAAVRAARLGLIPDES